MDYYLSIWPAYRFPNTSLIGSTSAGEALLARQPLLPLPKQARGITLKRVPILKQGNSPQHGKLSDLSDVSAHPSC